MLVLSRRLGEQVVIAGTIRVTILATQGARVRIGIAAPSSVAVHREEVYERRAEQAGRTEQVESSGARQDRGGTLPCMSPQP